MTVFLKLTGRLGNLLFQYAYARAFCEQNGHTLCTPPWIGETIFQIPEAARVAENRCDIVLPESTYQYQSALIYTRKQVREWFKIRTDIECRLLDAITTHTILNRRINSDHINAGFVAPSESSYLKALNESDHLRDYYIWECDTLPFRLSEFSGDPSACGLNTTWVSLPSFYRLMMARVLFRANSTFSWWAATLGDGIVYSPIIKGLPGGYQDNVKFVQGNWPVMVDQAPNTDLHLREE